MLRVVWRSKQMVALEDDVAETETRRNSGGYRDQAGIYYESLHR